MCRIKPDTMSNKQLRLSILYSILGIGVINIIFMWMVYQKVETLVPPTDLKQLPPMSQVATDYQVETKELNIEGHRYHMYVWRHRESNKYFDFEIVPAPEPHAFPFNPPTPEKEKTEL